MSDLAFTVNAKAVRALFLALFKTCSCSSVRFEGLFAGLKLAGHSPAKCPARMLRKKSSTISPAKIQTRTPTQLAPSLGFLARPYYDP